MAVKAAVTASVYPKKESGLMEKLRVKEVVKDGTPPDLTLDSAPDSGRDSMPKWVYRFDELDELERKVKAAEGIANWESVRGLLGGKGANLAEMTRLGVPVPPGFTVTTAACNSYMAGGETLPAGLMDEVAESLVALEGKMGKRLGDPTDPLLVSV